MKNTACDCGRDFKGYRGLVQHWHRGCPDAIVNLFMQGRSMRDLAKKFDKPLAKIEGVIRRAAIERDPGRSRRLSDHREVNVS